MPITQEGLKRFGNQKMLDQAFYFMAANGEIEKMENLLALGADINAVNEAARLPPLWGAVEKHRFDAFAWLLEKGTCPRWTFPEAGTTLAMYLVACVIHGGKQAEAKKAGVWERLAATRPALDVESTLTKLTALYRTLESDDAEVAKELLDIGASPDAPSNGMSPLLWALYWNARNCFHLLLTRGVDIYPPGRPTLSEALAEMQSEDKSAAAEIRLKEAQGCLDLLTSHLFDLEETQDRLCDWLGANPRTRSDIRKEAALSELIAGGKATPLLLQFAGAKMLDGFFKPSRWEETDPAEIRLLYRQFQDALPPRYQARLALVDMNWAAPPPFEIRLQQARQVTSLEGKRR